MPAASPPFASTLAAAVGRPLFAPLREAAAGFAALEDWPDVAMYTAHVPPSLWPRAATGAPLALVPQTDKGARPRGPRSVESLYDGLIVERGEVPTRPRNWHDFWNFLVWVTFPRAKRAVHERQLAAHRARLPSKFVSQPGARTREQDALALLDEGGLLVLTTSASHEVCVAAVHRGDDGALGSLAASGAVVCLLFGHAVYEHLAGGARSVVRAKATPLVAARLPDELEARVALADELLAAQLADPSTFQEPGGSYGVPITDALFCGSLTER